MPPTRLPNGRFPKGVSGNVNGRPPKLRSDSADTALVRSPPTQRRADAYANPYTGHGTARDRRIYTHFTGDIVSDTEALNLWETEFLAARIIEAMPEEGYRRGWSLKLQDEELAEELMHWAEELGVEDAVVRAWETENALGGAAIFPVIDGAQGDLSTPLKLDRIGDIKAIHVLEPRELTAIEMHASLEERSWSQPSMYMFTPIASGLGSIYGTQWIHASRLIVFPGLRVSRQNRPGQRLGWGVSRLTRPKQVLADFGLAWGSAATLLHEHDMGFLALEDFAELMATEEGEQIVLARLRAMGMAKSTLRALVGGANDKFTKIPSSLSGLADVLNEFKILMSAASDGMPVSVLMGQSQSGLRTGDDDTLTWYGNVEKRRRMRIRPRHTRLMEFLLAAGNGPTGGTMPDVYAVEYPSMWSPSDKEVAETRKTDMDRAVAAVNAQIVSADDVAESFYGANGYPQHGDIKVNWERRKAQQAVQQMGEEDLTDEDRAAMGGEQADLTDDERAQLAALKGEFGTEDGDLEPEANDEEDDDFEEEPDDEEDDDREDADDDWREDQVGISLSGHGYNPYRDKGGKFAPGAHKEKPSAGERAQASVARAQERVGKAKASVDKHAGKLAAAHEGKHAALAETRSALAKAQAAAELARAKPTAKNIKAAQVATNKATRAQAKVDKHEAAIAKHTAAHEKATTAHAKATEAHGKAQARLEKHQKGDASKAEPTAKTKSPQKPEAKPADAGRANGIPRPESSLHPGGKAGHPDLSKHFADRSAIANGVVYDSAGKASFTPEGQRALRGHLDGVAAAYGLSKRDLPDGHIVNIADVREMGGAAAQFEEHGSLRIQSHTAQSITRHAEYKPEELTKGRPYDGDEIQAYHYVTHESSHGHGPLVPYEGHGILADEAATEIVARRITADIHGLQSTDIGLAGRGGGPNKHGAYNKHIYSMAHAIGQASGRNSAHGFKSLENAAFAMKRLPVEHEFSTGDAALHHLVELAANHAGIKDSARRAQLHEDMRTISEDLLSQRARAGRST